MHVYVCASLSLVRLLTLASSIMTWLGLKRLNQGHLYLNGLPKPSSYSTSVGERWMKDQRFVSSARNISSWLFYFLNPFSSSPYSCALPYTHSSLRTPVIYMRSLNWFDFMFACCLGDADTDRAVEWMRTERERERERERARERKREREGVDV